MSDTFLSLKLDEFRTLAISELSSQTVKSHCFDELISEVGLYLYVVDDSSLGGITILAKVPSIESALSLSEIIREFPSMYQSTEKLTVS